MSAEAYIIFDRFKQTNRKDTEKGGIILGRLIDDRIHIQKLSVPSELDKSSRFNFERHRLSAQFIIDYEFVNSHGQLIYLGEWHTHPEASPTPSPQDIKMINEQFRNNKIYTNFLLLAIQGLEKLYIGVIDDAGLNGVVL